MKQAIISSLFKKNKNASISLIEKNNHTEPILNFEKDSDLEKQLKMIGLTESDLLIARALKEYVEPYLDEIVTSFYARMENVSELISIINNNSTVERLKKTLRIHISEMFDGVIDEKFIHKRIRIAHAHVEIGLKQKWYIASFQGILTGLMKVIEENIPDPSEKMTALTVVSKLLNFEQQIVMEAYDNQIEKLRDADLNKQQDLRKAVGITANELAALTEETSASIEEITAQVEEISAQSSTGTQMAEQAEETANLGKQQLDALHQTFVQVQESTTKISEEIESLEKTSSQIGDIVEIVKSIAEQTNLLALNASIEAARAGEHGLGFAVVADEVRKLAEQTSQSVTRVTDLIEQTNDQIRVNSSSIKQVESIIAVGGKKMEDTETAFEEIVNAMNEAKSINEKMQTDLEGVNEVINEIAKAAESIAVSAEELNKATEKLN
ncbi:globin-coupled sensor protein [Pueribacillus theae]|nr:globin-coupled sensor protein [Pueribacillus theae]